MTNHLMTSAERMTAVFNHQKPDRVPIISFVGAFAAKLAGIPIKEYYTNPELAIDIQIKAQHLYGYDDGPHYGWADWGGWEFGGDISFPERYKESSPKTLHSVIKKPSQVDNLVIPDPETAGMMPLIRRYNRRLVSMGLNAKIQGGSPTLIAAGIIGKERLLRWYLREPEAVKVVYAKAVDFILRVAKRTIAEFGPLSSAGFTAPLDANDLISPEIFETFCFPAISKVNRKLMKMGVSSFFAHLCGNHRLNLKLWASLPWPERMTFSLGPEMDLETTAEAFDHKHIIAGNVSTTLLAHGSYEEVYQNTKTCIEKGKELPGGFILMSGCEMPVLAPPLNVHAMVQAALDHGRYEKLP